MSLNRVAGAALAALVVVLLVTAPAIVRAMMSNADYVSPLVMGERAHMYPDSEILLGNYGWWAGMWAVQWLRPLPFSDVLAAGLPFLITLIVYGLVAAQARSLMGTRAGLIVGAVSLATTSAVWVAAASWSAHAPTWWAMGLAGIAVTAAAADQRRRAAAAAVATVAIGALTLSGDKLAYAALIAPLAAAAVVALITGRRRASITAFALAAVTVGLALLAGELAADSGYVTADFKIELLPYGALGAQAGAALVSLQTMYAGDGATVIGASAAYLGAGLLVAALLSAPRGLRGAAPPKLVWGVFWATAALALLGAFCVSSRSVIEGVGTARYLYGLPLACGALLAVAAWQRVALVLAAVLAVATSINLLRDPPQRQPLEHGPALSKVLDAARKHDVTRGYAGYWTAYPLERASRFELEMTPVIDCGAAPNGLCPFHLHRITRAYEPRPGRSFLLREVVAPTSVAEYATREPIGVKPFKRVDVGDGLEMLIYSEDIVANLGPGT